MQREATKVSSRPAVMPPGSARLTVLALCVAAGALAGCGGHPQPSVAADQFLKDTVSRYGAMKSFATDVSWTASSPGGALDETRKFAYTAPNKYAVVTTHDSTLQETSVCDGAQITEYSNAPDTIPQILNAPDTFPGPPTAQTSSIVSAADPLYGYFTGKYDKVVDPKGAPPVYGGGKTVGGVDCEIVYYRSPVFGPVRATIGVKDHLVREIQYQGAPLLAKAGTMVSYEFAKPVPDPAPQTLPVTESYAHPAVDAAIPDSTFETRVPETLPPLRIPGGPPQQVAQGGGSGQGDDAGQGADGLPVGSAAPDITVTDVRSGQSTKLSSLRGHPVMIDFWATWCPPCRMSLPLTQKFARQYGPQGLQVMAISDEDRETITQFLNKNHYTFPTYRDTGQSAMAAYHVTGIPAIFVIDKDGKIKHYQAGYGGPEPEQEALKLVGFGA